MREVQGAAVVQERAPRWARWFVAVFLGMFVVCGVVGIEAWPLTGWRLFSHLRSDHVAIWEAATVDDAGAEHALRLQRLPAGYRNLSLVMKGFAGLSGHDRAALCRTLAVAARERDPSVTALRLYRLDRSLVPRRGDRPARAPTRTLLYECGAG